MTVLAALLCQEGNEGRARRVWLFNMQIRRWRLIGWRDSAWLCYDVISRHTHTHTLTHSLIQIWKAEQCVIFELVFGAFARFPRMLCFSSETNVVRIRLRLSLSLSLSAEAQLIITHTPLAETRVYRHSMI